MNLPPKVERRLREEARKRDLSVADYISLLLDQSVGQENATSAQNPSQEDLHTEAFPSVIRKNQLQEEVNREERIIAEMERKADLALQAGNRELAKQFLKEKTLHIQALQQLLTQLVAATESAAENTEQADSDTKQQVQELEAKFSRFDSLIDAQLDELEQRLFGEEEDWH